MATSEVNPKPPPPAGVLTTLFGEGCGTYQVRHETFLVSLVLHVAAAALIVASSSFLYRHRQEIKQEVTGLVVNISPYVLPPSSTKAGGGGGGGDRDKLAASKGALPKLARDQVTPPAVVVRNESPKLAVDPSVVVPPNIPLPHTGQLGDPLSNVLGPASNGTGSAGGIGSGSGGGVGSGRGPGVGPGWGGGIGGGPYRIGGGVSAPKPIFTPDPEYSEEARKAKFQGTVVLWLVIGPDGKAHEIRVARALGMGLDEKAVEAVRTWRFDPAKKDGQPVAVQMNVEVSFRLY
jgi:TonB family protein